MTKARNAGKISGVMVRIYVLMDPRDGAVRYVGKTVKALNARLSGHIHCARTKNTYRDRWVASLLDAGVRPIIEAIESVGNDWAQREAYWIAHYRTAGAKLTNHTEGGEGVTGHRHSEEFKAAQSARTKAAMTPERRTAHGEAMRRVAADPEWRARHSEKTLARMTSETRAHLSRKTKESMTPERLVQMSAAQKARQTPERIEAQRAAVKKTTASPQWRARQSAAISKAMTPERRAVLALKTSESMTPERRRAIAETQARVAADPAYKERQRIKQREAAERRRADPEAMAKHSAALKAGWTAERRAAQSARARAQREKR